MLPELESGTAQPEPGLSDSYRRQDRAPEPRRTLGPLCTWPMPLLPVIRLLLVQQVVDTNANEPTATLPLLQRVAVSGCNEARHSYGFQKSIAPQFIGQGAVYILALTKNKTQLHAPIAWLVHI